MDSRFIYMIHINSNNYSAKIKENPRFTKKIKKKKLL